MKWNAVGGSSSTYSSEVKSTTLLSSPVAASFWIYLVAGFWVQALIDA
jgi:hypothetical protein